MEGIDLSHIARRFARACRTYDDEAVAQQKICRTAAGYLAEITESLSVNTALEIGCGTGGFTEYLQSMFSSAIWTLNDLCEESVAIASRFAKGNTIVIAGDAEKISWTSHYDLIVSASAVQWFRRPDAWIAAMANIQEEGGILFFTTFLPETLFEIRSITSKGLDYPTTDDWRVWLADYYDVVLIKDEEIVLTFDTPMDVLKHLKLTGVTATGNEFWTRSKLEEFSVSYKKQYSEPDGRVKLTYHPVYIACRRKK